MSGSLEDRKSLSWVGTRAPSDVWLFTSGALMNQVILAQQQLQPKAAAAGVIPGFRRIFSGQDAVTATLWPSAADKTHGVLFKFSEALLPRLETLHGPHVLTRAQAELYSGHRVECILFVSEEAADRPPPPEALPTARDVGILAEGAQQHGVEPAAVEMLRGLPCVPRKPSEALLAFAVPALPEHADKLTMGDLEANMEAYLRGEAAHSDCFIVVNRKVLRWIGPAEHPLLDSIQRRPIDKTLGEAQRNYDPLYGMPHTLREMADEHKALVEDTWASSAYAECFQCIGFIADYAAPPPAPEPVPEE